MNEGGRKQVILAVVKQNPKISQNALKRLVCDRLGSMSGRTFDSLIVEIRKDKVLLHEKIKNRITYTTPKNTDMKDISFLRAIEGELFHVNKTMTKTLSQFSSQHQSKQITLVLAISEFLTNIEMAYFTIKPFYDDPQTKKIQKRLREMSILLHKLIRQIDSEYIRLVGMQFFGFASNKRIEIDKLLTYKNAVR